MKGSSPVAAALAFSKVSSLELEELALSSLLSGVSFSCKEESREFLQRGFDAPQNKMCCLGWSQVSSLWPLRMRPGDPYCLVYFSSHNGM